MKETLFSLYLITISSIAHANWECVFRVSNFQQEAVTGLNATECIGHIKSYIREKLYDKNMCQDKKMVSFTWSFKEVEMQENEFSCSTLKKEFFLEDVKLVSNTTSYLSNKYKVHSTKSKGLNAIKIDLEFSSEDEAMRAAEDFIPGVVFDRSKDRWQMILKLPNDNKGLGLFDMMFNDYGNDQSYTHGILISFAKGVANQYHLNFEYKSKLYTKIHTRRNDKPIEDGEIFNQYFLEENFAKIILDNRDKKKASYYTVGVGWHQLNQEKLGNLFQSSAKQQKEWHQLLGKYAREYNYLGGNGIREGMFVGGSVGRDDTLLRGQRYRVTSNIETGIGLSKAERESNFVEAKASLNIDYQKYSFGMSYRLGLFSNIKKYWKSNSYEIHTGVGFEMGKKSFSCGISASKRLSEQGVEYLKYDSDNELITDIHCSKKL